ncbi:adenosine deaminase 2-like [Phymastichus coffea]|uniref:adenosine deaminase 2-like n=1 Tax=Phymastichus coffea TaxID=108790 RepID=UPI00273CCC0C|nr:adenosine deaminase 2-like [Phymastichus coffea]
MDFHSKVFAKLVFCAWLLINHSGGHPISCKYLNLRQQLIKEEEQLSFGANITLLGDEIAANECVMRIKKNEVNEAFNNPEKFLPAKNFMEARRDIEKSDVFKILWKMPKGGVFHAHSTAIADLDYLVYNVTRLPNLYVCSKDEDDYRFKFFENPDDSCDWVLLKHLEDANSYVEENIRNYNLKIKSKYDNSDEAWKIFNKIYETLRGIVKYRPVFEEYFYKALQKLYDDNVMFMEMRTSLGMMYELNGTKHEPLDIIRIYKEVSDRFIQSHPDFLGIKIIFAPKRRSTPKKFSAAIEIFKKVKAAYPDLVVGFDLVGQEDKGHPLLEFANELQELSNITSFYFHAGETNWYGTSSDYNLYDAILLNTKRIGHGYALLKHPKLMEIVKKRNIAIELNPISNQILHLLQDMRNHPASYFFAENFPVVVSNDDPSYWDAQGLSYDFYETFVGIMSREADLRALKQLAINSIVYSSLNADEQKRAFQIFDNSWRTFVANLIDSPMCNR